MKLDDALKVSLQEIRMQMLGTQVLFGFQVQALFQDRFIELPRSGRLMDGIALAMIIVVMALLLAVPSQHRLVEEGESSSRLFGVSLRYANYALGPLGVAIAADIYVAVLVPFGSAFSTICFLTVVLMAALIWLILALSVRSPKSNHKLTMSTSPTPLHAKIEEMLTEARVILPGAQALLGFQLIVMMTRAFGELSREVQIVHVVALLSLGITVVLLIAPAAIHRIGFRGLDDPRLHSMGSVLITAALAPLAVALTCDVWVALTRLFNASAVRMIGTTIAGVSLLAMWYALPIVIRRQTGRGR